MHTLRLEHLHLHVGQPVTHSKFEPGTYRIQVYILYVVENQLVTFLAPHVCLLAPHVFIGTARMVNGTTRVCFGLIRVFIGTTRV